MNQTNPYHPYLNKFHKETSEQKMKEIEEQKQLQLNSKDEVKKHLEMHKRIAQKYPNGSI
jgi:hypothetical protein